jgi:hypothetical protein
MDNVSRNILITIYNVVVAVEYDIKKVSNSHHFKTDKKNSGFDILIGLAMKRVILRDVALYDLVCRHFGVTLCFHFQVK